MKGLVVPAANARESAVVDGVDIIPVASLTEAVAFFSDQLDIPAHLFCWEDAVAAFGRYQVDDGDVKGKESTKRAVTVAAAGAHHLLR